MLGCENVEEVEAHIMERWSEMVASEGGNNKFYSEVKGIIR